MGTLAPHYFSLGGVEMSDHLESGNRIRVLTDNDRERVRLVTIRDTRTYPAPSGEFDGRTVASLMLEAARSK